MSVSPTSKLPLAIGLLAIVIGGAALAQAYSLNSQLANLSTSVSNTSTKVADISKQIGPKTQRLTIILGEGEVIGEVGGKDQITGEFHRWEPPVIVVRKGDTVILDVKNPRKHIHSFVLKDFNVDTGPLMGRTGASTVQFVADKEGVFQFSCEIKFDEKKGECDPDHRRMVGYVIVLA